MGNIVIVGGDAGAALDVTYVTSLADTAAATTYTSFPTASIGTTDANRLVLVGFSATAAAARTFTSATIDGSAATEYGATIENGTTQCCIAGWFGLKLSTGTTADIRLTFSGNVSNCTLHIYRILTTQTAAGAEYDFASGASASSAVATLDSPAGGAIFAVCTTGTSSSGTGHAVTEADVEDNEQSSESAVRSSSSRKATESLVTGQTMTGVFSGSPSNGVISAVSIQG
jgi:hypothetical protein